MGGGDAISVQEVRRKTHRGRKEEGGEAVKPGGVKRTPFLPCSPAHALLLFVFVHKDRFRNTSRQSTAIVVFLLPYLLNRSRTFPIQDEDLP